MEAELEKRLDEEATALVARIISGVTKRLAERPGSSAAESTKEDMEPARPSTEELKQMSADLVAAALRQAFHELTSLTDKQLNWESAQSIIETVVESWNLSDKWKYHIEKEAEGDGYIQAKLTWSIPMRRRPVPNATAYTRFNLTKLTKEIDVEWRLEQQQLAHSASELCREQWLHDVLASKRLIQEQIQL
eukprot:m.88833 g.88833  ORF g.88833 m.88833 type:complete len:191 (-) comp14552_c0_seq3:121-693(-)